MKNSIVALVALALVACGGSVSRDENPGEMDTEPTEEVALADDGDIVEIVGRHEVTGEAGSSATTELTDAQTGGNVGEGGSPGTAADSVDAVEVGTGGNAGNDSDVETDIGAAGSVQGSSGGNEAGSGTIEVDPRTDGNAGAGGDNGSAGAAGADAGDCTSEVHLEYVLSSSETIVPGTTGFTALQFRLSACQDLEVSGMSFQIVARDHDADDTDPHVDADGNRNFQNVRVLDAETGIVVAGPVSPVFYTANQMSHVSFSDAFVLSADEPRLLTVVLDVPETFRSDAEATAYAVYHTYVDAGDSASVSYAPGFLNPWRSFTVWDEDWQPCVHTTQTLDVQTYSHALRGTGDSGGFMLLGSSIQDEERSELQFWDSNGEQGMTLNVGSGTSLISGSTEYAYFVDAEWPLVAGGYGSKQFSMLDHEGHFMCSFVDSDPLHGPEASADNNVYWAQHVETEQSMQFSVWGKTMDAQCGGSSEKLFDWQDDSVIDIINAARSGNTTALVVLSTCNKIPVGGCPVYYWLATWDHTVPAEEREVTFVELDGAHGGLFAEEDGFAVYDNTNVIRYSFSGEFLSTVVLPEHSRIVTRFSDGYAAIATTSESLKDFTFFLLGNSGEVLGTIPFSGDVDRYELALSDLVRFGGNRFAFAWGTLGTELDRRSRLELFECRQ